MAMAPASHRRRGATYGKPYRKPLIDATFATDGQSSWTERWSPHLSHDGITGIPKQLQSPTESPAPPSKDSQTKTALKPDGNALHELPSSEEERRKSQGGQKLLTIRKRRKLTEGTARDGTSPVFDDESLQKHIAEEVSGMSHCRLTQPGNDEARWLPHKGVQPDRRTGHRGPKQQSERRPIAGKRGQKGRQRGDKPPKTKIPTSTNASMTNNMEDLPWPKTPSKALSKYSGPPRQRSIMEEQSRTSLPQPPNTPPRQIPDAQVNGTSTPRQRDLWHRLLADSDRSVSPSYLDLFGLRIVERTAEFATKSSNLTNEPDINGRGRGLRSRPRRLIDTLNGSRTFPVSPGIDSSDEAVNSSSDSEILSRTDDSVPITVDDFHTLQTSPSTVSQTRTTQAVQPVAESTVQGSSVLETGRSRITYAQQRSYLVDLAIEQERVFDIEAISSTGASQQSRSRPLGAIGHCSPPIPSHPCDLEGAPEVQNGTMRSIHELRQAGGNARLLGEIETLLDQLDESQGKHSVKRSALIGLASKFQEPSHCRTFVDKGLESRLVRHVDGRDDLITKSLVATTMLRLIVQCHSAVLLSKMCDVPVINFLVGLLSADEDLIRSSKNRGFNMSKVAQRDYSILFGEVLKSAIWRSGRPDSLSCHVLSLQCLEYLVRRQREGGMTAEILAPDQFQCLIETSLPEAALLSQLDTNSNFCVHLAVSILESCTVKNAHGCEEFWPESVLTRITGILPAVHSWSSKGSEALQILVLRLYLNVTNTVPRLCESFAQPDIVGTLFSIIMSYFNSTGQHHAKDQSLLLDQVILSLGCLINFSEMSDAMRDLSLIQRQGQPRILDLLLDLFMANSPKAAEVSVYPSRLYNLLTLSIGLF